MDGGEIRTLMASAALAGYLAELEGVEARQVVRLQSHVTHVGGARGGQTTRLVRYFLTSLSSHVLACRLLRLVREHWHIENRLQYVRDVTLGEDASQVRSGAAPEALAPVRDAVLGLLRQHGYDSSIAAALCAISRGRTAQPSGCSASTLHYDNILKPNGSRLTG